MTEVFPQHDQYHTPLPMRNEVLLNLIERGITPLLPFEADFLHQEFSQLVEVQRKNGRRLGESMQDSSETWHDNAAADQINAESLGIARQADALTQRLNGGFVMEYPSDQEEEATLGSVAFVDFGDGNKEPMLITGAVTELVDPAGIGLPDNCEVVTVKSPLGQALIGRRAGETTSYEVNGRILHVNIVALHQLSDQVRSD